MAGNILGHDDGVIDKQAQGQDEARDRELVDREARIEQKGHANGQRQGYRDHDNDRGAPAQRQQRDEHQAEGDREVPGQRVQPLGHVLGLVERPLHGHALRQVCLEGIDRLEDTITDGEDVLIVHHVGAEEDGALAVESGLVPEFGVSPVDLGDVAHAQGTSVDRGDNGVPDLFE